MKRKKIISIIALALSAITFSACTETDSKVTFFDFWNPNVQTPTGTEIERLEYDVTFEALSGLDSIDYSIDYKNGKYVTELTANKVNNEITYTYTTTLDIDVMYTLDGVTSAPLHDHVESKVVFKGTSNWLQPISSTKTFACHSPSNSDATKIEDCYHLYQYAIQTTYDESGKSGECTMTVGKTDPKSTTDTFAISTKKYTYLDNEQILFALRGIDPTDSSSQTFLVYNYVDEMQKVKTKFGSVEQYQASFTKDGQALTNASVACRPVTISVSGSKVKQYAWYAAADGWNSEYRNVLLKFETSLPYSLGTLIYQLKSADFTD